MEYLQLAANGHWLLWLVPFTMALTGSGLGAGMPRRLLTLLALAGLLLPFCQSILAVLFFLLGPAAAQVPQLKMTAFSLDGRFALAFALDAKGAWAMLLCLTVALAAMVHALASVARLAGRHRYLALILTFVASAGFLFTAQSPMPLLIGWEGLALCGAFLAGFWEPEAGGGRTGMRWLIFQRASGVLLVVGFLSRQWGETWTAAFVLAALAVRAGQLPFHGWIPGSTRAPASTTNLVHGVGSLLAATYLMDQFWPLIASAPYLAEIAGFVGAAGVSFGILAGFQQHRSQTVLGWLFMVQGGLIWMAFAVGDPVAARLLASSGVLVLGGMMLAMGDFSVSPAALGRSASGLGKFFSQRGLLVLGAAMALPPSLNFLALGRLCGSAPESTLGWLIRALTGVALFGFGWMFQRMEADAREIATSVHQIESRWPRWAALSLGGLAVTAGLGVLLAHELTPAVYGGSAGLFWASLSSGLAVLGWLLGRALSKSRPHRLTGRLTASQRTMDRVASTGLGLGEMVVQFPLISLRLLGVVIWRGLGDFIIDTLVLGTAVRSIEGIGTALRYLQNGRIQRYTLMTVLATLLLIKWMQG